MRVIVNLATRPFVELRPFFLRLRILMAALLVAAIGFGLWAHIVQQRLNRARAQMNVLVQQTVAAEQEQHQAEARMRQPQNAAVLDRAHFLNALFLRKSFSWTAVMMDLEDVLPSGVQVTAIEPQVIPSGDVIIRLRVSGERDRAIQLVRNLERSKRFLQPRLSGESTEAKEGGARPGQRPQLEPGAPAGVQFDILATYNPLPEGESYPKVKKTALAEPGAAASHARAGGLSPATNARRGYPPNGVVLRPYNATPSPRPIGNPAVPRRNVPQGGVR